MVGTPSLFGGRILSYVFGSSGKISEIDNDRLRNGEKKKNGFILKKS